jgi:hypothetical protein
MPRKDCHCQPDNAAEIQSDNLVEPRLENPDQTQADSPAETTAQPLLPDPLSDDRERDGFNLPVLAACVVLVLAGRPVTLAMGLLGPMLWVFYIVLFFCFFYAFKLRDDRKYLMALLTMAIPYVLLPLLNLLADLMA